MNFLKSKNGYGDYKYCPICGSPSKISNAYCIRCGHSFNKSNINRKKTNRKNLMAIIILIVIAYFGLRYATGQALMPISVEDALNISFSFKK
jgi:predicted nucleic acid-binding Zn ribbon protein